MRCIKRQIKNINHTVFALASPFQFLEPFSFFVGKTYPWVLLLDTFKSFKQENKRNCRHQSSYSPALHLNMFLRLLKCLKASGQYLHIYTHTSGIFIYINNTNTFICIFIMCIYIHTQGRSLKVAWQRQQRSRADNHLQLSLFPWWKGEAKKVYRGISISKMMAKSLKHRNRETEGERKIMKKARKSKHKTFSLW